MIILFDGDDDAAVWGLWLFAAISKPLSEFQDNQPRLVFTSQLNDDEEDYLDQNDINEDHLGEDFIDKDYLNEDYLNEDYLDEDYLDEYYGCVFFMLHITSHFFLQMI